MLNTIDDTTLYKFKFSSFLNKEKRIQVDIIIPEEQIIIDEEIYLYGTEHGDAGSVLYYLGKWKILGDMSEEFRDLKDAVKKCILIYLRANNEIIKLQLSRL